MTRTNTISKNSNTGPAQRQERTSGFNKGFLYLPMTLEMERPLKSSLRLQCALEKLSRASGNPLRNEWPTWHQQSAVVDDAFALFALCSADTLTWGWLLGCCPVESNVSYVDEMSELLLH